MDRGFYTIMSAQFFSALADNALLIAAIALLRDIGAPGSYEPLLKLVFILSYVLLAAFVGAFADSMPKARVMLIANSIKVVGCVMIIAGLHPLIGYAVVGLGAAAYSPAKYGIVTEYLPPARLVLANSWIEGLTVGAIVFGSALGGWLISPMVTNLFTEVTVSVAGVHPQQVLVYSMVCIAALYGIAAFINLYVPDTGVDHKPERADPLSLVRDFSRCVSLLWKDKLGQITLATTTLFWGAGATLQFIMLRWAEEHLDIPLHEATYLQGIFAVGVAVGAILAGKLVSIDRSVQVVSVGIAMGFVTCLMTVVRDPIAAGLLMTAVGVMAGFFVVPMNALLQHRGHLLMGAGHSIAVQNFNENLSILVMLGLYAGLVAIDLPIDAVILLFALFVSASMYGVRRWHAWNLVNHREELERLLAWAAAHSQQPVESGGRHARDPHRSPGE
ncbi:MAG: lysophospholipid transporter LplT [Burkholderiales bacterium]|nr:lysophospholipid transporter LplT [Betaproteobacteria bacterium]